MRIRAELQPRFCPLLEFRERNAPSCTFQRIVRSDHPVTLLTASLLIHNSAPTVWSFLVLLFPSSYHGSHGQIGAKGRDIYIKIFYSHNNN